MVAVGCTSLQGHPPTWLAAAAGAAAVAAVAATVVAVAGAAWRWEATFRLNMGKAGPCWSLGIERCTEGMKG